MVPEAQTWEHENEARKVCIREQVVVMGNQGWVLQGTLRSHEEHALELPFWSQEMLGCLLRFLSLIGWELSCWEWIPWLLQSLLKPEKAIRAEQ